MNQPNLLFIYTDEQAFDTLACYGNDWIDMPNLNALANESVVFDRAYVTQPVCTPSRSTLMTGQWPHTNGCIRNNLALRPETPCLPELLPTGEYKTGHYGKWHLGDEIFCQHGFDEWQNYEDMYGGHYGEERDRDARSGYHHYLVDQGYSPDNLNRNVFGRERCARLPEEHGKPAWISRKAVDFIDRHKDGPFALFVNFLEPHMPFFGPRDEQYDPTAIPLPANHDAFPDAGFSEKYLAKLAKEDPRTEEEWRTLRARYYGLCSLVDTHAGSILDALKQAGHWDDTIIVFTSDHGDMMGAHGMTAKGVMYEEAVRVPMLIKVPGQKRMKRVKGRVSHIDVMPTILELMGKTVPDTMQGESLRPLMEADHAEAIADVFIEWNSSASDGGEPNNEGEAAIERTILTADDWKFVWSSDGKHLLFNLSDDPGETVNLYGREEHCVLVDDLMERICEWQKRVADPADPIA